jgi:hypothetical protein
MANNQVAPKDPNSIEPYFFVWCDADGTNTGAAGDDGELQGATIASYTLTVPSGITKTTDNKAAVTIHGVAYAINTVVTCWLSGGTDGADYSVNCQIVTNDSPARTLEKTMEINVRSQ